MRPSPAFVETVSQYFKENVFRDYMTDQDATCEGEV